MIAVAQVTLNRANGGDVCKTVYARKQFSWTSNEKPMRDYNAVRLAELAVKLAQEGKSALFLNSKLMKATHYHTNNVSPLWSKRVRKVAAIGRHIFYVG